MLCARLTILSLAGPRNATERHRAFGAPAHGVAYTELATLAGASRAGTALGLANSFVFVAFFLAPIAIPGLLVMSSWTGVWLAAAACALVAWPIFLRPDQGRKSVRVGNDTENPI